MVPNRLDGSATYLDRCVKDSDGKEISHWHQDDDDDDDDVMMTMISCATSDLIEPMYDKP